MKGVKEAAIRLSTLCGHDRRWVLSRLSSESRWSVEQALAELAAKRIPQGVLRDDSLLRGMPCNQQASSSGPANTVLKWLAANEPAPVLAALIEAGAVPEREMLSACSWRTRKAVARHLRNGSGLPERAHEALREAADMQGDNVRRA